MARFVIQNKVYDTDKMKLAGNVRKWYKFTGWVSRQLFGEDMGRICDCKLYRSDKGNWLLVHEGGTGLCGEAIKLTEAKELLLHCDYDSYVALFGALEEA